MPQAQKKKKKKEKNPHLCYMFLLKVICNDNYSFKMKTGSAKISTKIK